MTEFHPFYQMIQGEGYDYFYKNQPDVEVSKGSYTDGELELESTTFQWNHSLTDIFAALENNGLKLTSFQEFDYCPFLLRDMVQKEKNKFVLKKRMDKSTPYIYNLTAVKK